MRKVFIEFYEDVETDQISEALRDFDHVLVVPSGGIIIQEESNHCLKVRPKTFKDQLKELGLLYNR